MAKKTIKKKAAVKPRNRKAQDATLINIDALKTQLGDLALDFHNTMVLLDTRLDDMDAAIYELRDLVYGCDEEVTAIQSQLV